MPALEPLCHLIGINSQKLSKDEMLLLEAELFARICEELNPPALKTRFEKLSLIAGEGFKFSNYLHHPHPYHPLNLATEYGDWH